MDAMNNLIEFPKGRKATTTRLARRPVTYTVDEAAELLGISRAHAYRCIKAGTLPAIKFGRRIVVPARAVNSMLAQAGMPSALQP